LDRKSEHNLTISSAYWISLPPSSLVYLRLEEPVGWAFGDLVQDLPDDIAPLILAFCAGYHLTY